MKHLSVLLASLLLIFLAFNSCSQNEDEGVLIEGTVLNETTRQPIENALVQVSSPEEFSNVFTRSDSLGQYSLGTLDITEVTDLTITVSAPNYEDLIRPLKVAPDDQISGFNFELTSGETDGDGDGDDEPSGPSGGAAIIELVDLSNETINIAATGGVTSSVFTFEVQDSSGNSLDVNNAIDVQFSIKSGPGGGESITPTVVTTNEQGQASATLKSGNIAGVVKVEARIERTVTKISPISGLNNADPELTVRGGSPVSYDNSTSSKQSKSNTQDDIVITSEPVAVTIHGGFPDENNFTITSDNLNYEFTSETEAPITVLLGDEYSNPVKPGTAVYFSATNGLIDGSAQGHTDEEGKASVTLTPRGTGSAVVTAKTIDKNDQEIEKNINLLFSTSKADIVVTDEVTIAGGETASIDYTITDRNGNPLAPGTLIEVTSGDALTLSGTTQTTLGDELSGGEGITDFGFNIRASEDFNGSENVTITSTSPSGVQSTAFVTVNSTGSGVSGDPEEPASMSLVSLSAETINIAESGGVTNSTFTFQVQDSAGRSLDSQSAVDVTFSILSNPGGAYITPTTVSTDAQGRVTSNLNAGDTAGVVQIQAQVVDTEIKSKPVAVTIHGGFPDEDHFTLEPLTNTNIEGFDRNGVEIDYKVRLGDEFSNPVKPGTAVYFETTGGVIEGSGVSNTDNSGLTSVTLFAGNPRPSNGQGTVTATTIDADGNEISKSSDFIFSTSKATISPDITELTLSPGSKYENIGYTVTDENANPMAAGTQIEVTSSGNQLELTGNTVVTMPNELEIGPGITDYEFTIAAGDNFDGSEKIVITVTSPSGTVTTNQELVVSSTGGGVSGPPAGAAAIILESVENETINIKETGGIVNSSFTFQVQDSSGRPLNMDNPVDVDFEIIQGPGGGEGILPETATTNSTGRVTSNLFSGNAAGVVMLQATVTRDDIGLTLRSKPVAITIHGGFPDEDHFSIRPANDNFGGYDRNGIENTIEVIVGDKFSNPVKPGTAVYFETTGGVIEGSGLGHTDEQGRVSVQLISADPRPDDATTVDGTSMDGRPGLATITAKTVNENNDLITKSTNVLFSTNSADISATPTTFDLAPNGGASFDYTVTDKNGNPMPAGTQFEIEAGEGIDVTGSGSFVLGDHLLPGPGATEFSFSIRDTDDTNDDPADLTLVIKVTAPNGNVTTYDAISGTRRNVTDTGTGVKSNDN